MTNINAELVVAWEAEAERITEAVVKRAPDMLRRATDALYETMLCDVQDYLRENVLLNLSSELTNAKRRAELAQAEIDRLRKTCARQNEEFCQVLGKALGYPWFKDDPANFPDATEEHGVCVSDHVAESLADEAAARIKSLEARALAAEAEVARLTAEREKDRQALQEINDTGAEQDGALGRILRMQIIARARLEDTHD